MPVAATSGTVRRTLPVDAAVNGLGRAPVLAVGDGALAEI